MCYYKKILKYIFLCIFLIFFWLVLHTITIIIEGTQEDTRNADIGVIFGAKNEPDGSLSQPMERRLNVGLKLYQEGKIQKILVSGGRANQNFCESDLMQDYLISKGVRLGDIITDNKARNTEENVENSLQIMKENNYKKLIIISQYYHISRIKLMYYKKGFYNIGSVSSRHFNKKYHPQTLVREFFGYYYYYFFK